METLDTIVTYAYDLTLGGGALYIGTSLIVYLVDRWRELEVKPRPKTPQAVNIPLELKATTAEAVPLAEVPMSRPLEAVPEAPPEATLIEPPAPLEAKSLRSTEPKSKAPKSKETKSTSQEPPELAE